MDNIVQNTSFFKSVIASHPCLYDNVDVTSCYLTMKWIQWNKIYSDANKNNNGASFTVACSDIFQYKTFFWVLVERFTTQKQYHLGCIQ